MLQIKSYSRARTQTTADPMIRNPPTYLVIFLLCLGLTKSAYANFPSNIITSSLDGTDGFVISGSESGSNFGWAVAPGGDLNSDGFDDFIVSAPYEDASSSDSGAVYVIYGGEEVAGSGLVSINGLVASQSSSRISGQSTWGLFGYSLTGGTDFNADGTPDFAVGSSRTDSIVTYFGSSGGVSLGPVIKLSPSTHPYSNYYGLTLASGDFNNDGKSDIASSSFFYPYVLNPTTGFYDRFSGFVSVLPGRSHWPLRYEADANGDDDFFLLGNPSSSGYFGIHVADAGDVDGDGADDLIVTSIDYENTEGHIARAYIYFGGSNISGGSVVPFEAINDVDGVSIDFSHPADIWGYRGHHGIGDVNDDGYDDFAMVSSGYLDGIKGNIIFGGPHLRSSTGLSVGNLTASEGFSLTDDNFFNTCGWCLNLSAVGDVNNDGISDFAFGSHNDSKTYLILGGESLGSTGSLDVTAFNSEPVTIITGTAGVPAPIGDFNGDGIDDFALGKSSASFTGASNRGGVAIIFGVESDSDGDGFSNDVDNCPAVPNPTQSDVDNDGQGDYCDPDTDSDNDGLPDVEENALGTNPTDPDSDDDGLLDGEEALVHFTDPLNSDTDADGFSDGHEVDNDIDPLDSDIDDDGALDGSDNCLFDANADQSDSDGNGVGDVCDIPAIAYSVDEYLASGSKFSCTLYQSGRPHCWGDNTWGILAEPVGNNFGDFKSISARWDRACGIATDSDLHCWGFAGFPGSEMPTNVGPYEQASVGRNNTCALNPAGEIDCWGSLNNGMLVPPTSGAPYQAISLGQNHACALANDGSVECWGSNSIGQSNVPFNAGSFVQISAGGGHTCALRADGTALCWGGDNLGQSTIPSGAGPFHQIALGSSNTCAIETDGDTLCWGNNNLGQSDVPSVPSPFVQVAPGTNHTCGLRADRQLTCWGHDSSGETQPFNSSSNLPGPNDMDMDEVLDDVDNCPVDANTTQSDFDNDGLGDACDSFTDSDNDGLQNDDEGLYGTDPFNADSDGDGLTDGAEILAYSTNPLNPDTDGDSLTDGLEIETFNSNPLSSDTDADGFNDSVDNCPIDANPSQHDYDADGVGDACEVVLIASAIDTHLAVGQTHSCVLDTDGKVHCVGSNDRGQLNVPPGISFDSITGVGHHNCGLSSNQIICWRQGSANTNVPAGLYDAVKLSGGVNHFCALREDGSVVCWGSNVSGVIDAPASNSFSDIASGSYHNCGLVGAQVSCWGDNSSGQLDTPTNNDPFVSVGAGYLHSCGISNLGEVVCWGKNTHGESSPPLMNDAVDVDGGRDHTCALKADGSVECWGGNGLGQLDVPSVDQPFVQIASYYYHSCGLLADRTVRCWGNGNQGQLDLPDEEYGPPFEYSPDSDGDGFLDLSDNCPTVPNSDQSDNNSNGVGDLCDPLTTFASITAPPQGEQFSSDTAVFQWTGMTLPIDSWELVVGSSSGTSEHFHSGTLPESTTVLTVSGLPEDGSTLHARLSYSVGGIIYFVEKTYTASAPAPEIVSPLAGSVLDPVSMQFSWTDNGNGADNWWLYVGRSARGSELFNSGNIQSATSVTVIGLPTDGSPVYVTLWYRVNGGSWVSIEREYIAATGGGATPEIMSPADGSTITESNVTFEWSDNGAGVTHWWLFVGSAPNGANYYNSNNLGTQTSTLVTGLPTDGSTVYTTLWYRVNNGSWESTENSYQTSGASGANPIIISPQPDSILTGSSETFTWDSNGVPVVDWWIYAGTSPQTYNLHNSGNLNGATSETISGLPVDGSTVYVTLWYRGAGTGGWQHFTEEYTAFNATPEITSPISDVVSGSPVTFDWTDNNSPVTSWWLYIGTTSGANDLHDSGSLAGSTTSYDVPLPADGSTIYVRLWYFANGSWKSFIKAYTSN